MLKNVIDSYINKAPARFHMPGHKGELTPYDITELSFSDNLHNPSSVIYELQNECAAIYNAKSAFLLVNGSSAGNCAFFIALKRSLGRSPNVVVARNCHRSVISGAIMTAASACGVSGDSSSMAMELSQVFSSTARRIDAVCVTSPDYFGNCLDIEKISEIVHDYGALLYVDAAHGAHFSFSKHLPQSSVPFADACTISTHKTLCALNQTGIFFIGSDKLAKTDVQNALSLCQTTSPSYPLMLSIESSISACEREKWDSHCVFMRKYANSLIHHGIHVLFNDDTSMHDVTRLCISCNGMASSGFELSEALAKMNVFVEMADRSCVVCITSPHDKPEWYDMLTNSLICAKNSFAQRTEKCSMESFVLPCSHDFFDVQAAYYAATERLSLQHAVGRVAACPIGVYPPGTSIVLPGEAVSELAVAYLQNEQKKGGILFGTHENNIVEVVKNEQTS